MNPVPSIDADAFAKNFLVLINQLSKVPPIARLIHKLPSLLRSSNHESGL